MVLNEIANFQVFGISLIIYGGIITLLSLLFTASIAVLNKKGIKLIPFKWHPRMAIFSIILALIHGILSMLAYF